MIIEEKHVCMYRNGDSPSPLIIMNTFEGDGSDVYNALKMMTDKAFILAVISDIDWHDEMTPFECPPLFKKDSPYTGGADGYLKKLTEVFLPQIYDKIDSRPAYTAIAGYSLGGLFALYSLYKTDIFSKAVSASGSLWYPGIMDFIKENDLPHKPDMVYLSLGDKEALTKNQILSAVEKNTVEICRHFKDKGINTIFELNEGNHFKDVDIRLAKGISKIL